MDELLASYIALEVIGMNRDESIPLARVVLTEKTGFYDQCCVINQNSKNKIKKLIGILNC